MAVLILWPLAVGFLVFGWQSPEFGLGKPIAEQVITFTPAFLGVYLGMLPGALAAGPTAGTEATP